MIARRRLSVVVRFPFGYPETVTEERRRKERAVGERTILIVEDDADINALLAKIDEVLNHRVRTIEVVLPYDKLALADILRSRGSVAEEEYREEGVFYRATVKIDDLHRFEEYLL